MSIKNNDDVAHLLEAAGRGDAGYREFQNVPDSTSAPLIDAVFAQAPPLQESLQTPGLGSPSKDLLSEVFDRPPAHAPQPTIAAEQRSPAEAKRSDLVGAPAHTSYRRSLADIRRIITRTPSDEPDGPPSDSLHGLFDRLAG